MKTFTYALFSLLLISLAAKAQAPAKAEAPANSATGAGVVATGFECDVCHDSVSSAPIDSQQQLAAAKARAARNEQFLPGGNESATEPANNVKGTQ